MEPSEKKQKTYFSHSYKDAFKQVFPELVKELTEEGLNDPEISDGIRHLQRVKYENRSALHDHSFCFLSGSELQCPWRYGIKSGCSSHYGYSIIAPQENNFRPRSGTLMYTKLM
jgi:hypothetical protein